jgi:hypothetical protein
VTRYGYTLADYPEPGCPTYNRCIEDLQFDPKLEALGRAPTFFETLALGKMLRQREES